MVEKLIEPANSAKTEQQWFVYMLRCADGSLYTGITLDLDRRLSEHRGEFGVSKGAKSLRGKAPLALVYSAVLESRSVALKLEYKIKQLSKTKKEELVSGALPLSLLLL